jgi:hypothetical protein
MELVVLQVQRTHMEEGEQAEVDFHPHYHHMKKKLDKNKEQTSKMALRLKKAQLAN